jgi:hypothetical protein
VFRRNTKYHCNGKILIVNKKLTNWLAFQKYWPLNSS